MRWTLKMQIATENIEKVLKIIFDNWKAKLQLIWGMMSKDNVFTILTGNLHMRNCFSKWLQRSILMMEQMRRDPSQCIQGRNCINPSMNWCRIHPILQRCSLETAACSGNLNRMLQREGKKDFNQIIRSLQKWKRVFRVWGNYSVEKTLQC